MHGVDTLVDHARKVERLLFERIVSACALCGPVAVLLPFACIKDVQQRTRPLDTPLTLLQKLRCSMYHSTSLCYTHMNAATPISNTRKELHCWRPLLFNVGNHVRVPFFSSTQRMHAHKTRPASRPFRNRSPSTSVQARRMRACRAHDPSKLQASGNVQPADGHSVHTCKS